MKFGIFYELQLPRPWTQHSEHDLLHNALSQIELADGLGYDYAWMVEHHFLEEYSHCSAPEVFLGAATQRTKDIRLGHGIVQLTTNQPHRVAERVSTLDLLSNGRVEFGMGEGAGPAELHPFNIRVRDKRDRWEEAVKAIVELKPGQTASEDEIIALCKDELGSVKAPKSVEFWDELPRSAVGKVRKKDMRDRFWEGRDRAI